MLSAFSIFTPLQMQGSFFVAQIWGLFFGLLHKMCPSPCSFGAEYVILLSNENRRISAAKKG